MLSNTSVVGHFAPGEDPGDTLDRLGPFPAGTRAVIFGGSQDNTSNHCRQFIFDYFDDNPQIEVVYLDTEGAFVDRNGTVFIRPNDLRTGDKQ